MVYPLLSVDQNAPLTHRYPMAKDQGIRLELLTARRLTLTFQAKQGTLCVQRERELCGQFFMGILMIGSSCGFQDVVRGFLTLARILTQYVLLGSSYMRLRVLTG